MAFSEGNQLFAGDFCANMDEMNADMVHCTRNGTENEFYNNKDTFAEYLLLQMSVLHQSKCIFKAGLSS